MFCDQTILWTRRNPRKMKPNSPRNGKPDKLRAIEAFRLRESLTFQVAYQLLTTTSRLR